MRCSDCGEPMTPETVGRRCPGREDHPFSDTCQARCTSRLLYFGSMPAGWSKCDERCPLHGTQS